MDSAVAEKYLNRILDTPEQDNLAHDPMIEVLEKTGWPMAASIAAMRASIIAGPHAIERAFTLAFLAGYRLAHLEAVEMVGADHGQQA